MEPIDIEKTKETWAKRFSEASDQELQNILEEDKKKSGWVSARGVFLSLLREEFEKRGLDYK